MSSHVHAITIRVGAGVFDRLIREAEMNRTTVTGYVQSLVLNSIESVDESERLKALESHVIEAVNTRIAQAEQALLTRLSDFEATEEE